MSIRAKRMDAMYAAYNSANSNQRKEMLTFLMAIINHSQIKEFCENFELKIKK